MYPGQGQSLIGPDSVRMDIMMLASFWTLALSFVFILVSLLLIGLILLQKNRGSGLSGAFGGVGGHSAFGTKTGDFLTWLTVGLTGVFMLLAIIGNFAFEPADAARRRAAQNAPPTPVAPTPIPLTPTPTPVTPPPAAPVTSTPPAPAATTPPAPAASTPPTESPATPTDAAPATPTPEGGEPTP